MYLATLGMDDCWPNEVRNRNLLPACVEFGGFAAHDLRDAGFGGERRGDLHRAGIAGPEQHIRLGVQCLLNLGAGDTGVGLGVGMGHLQLAAEYAALGVDLFDREIDAVLPVGADGGAAAGRSATLASLIGAPDCAMAAPVNTVASRALAKNTGFMEILLLLLLCLWARPCERPLHSGCVGCRVPFDHDGVEAIPISVGEGANPVNNSKASAACVDRQIAAGHDRRAFWPWPR